MRCLVEVGRCPLLRPCSCLWPGSCWAVDVEGQGWHVAPQGCVPSGVLPEGRPL